MAKAEEMLKRYDVAAPTLPPEPEVDFVAYFVRASTSAGGVASPPGQPIPPVLQEAIAEMKKTFAYTEYTLLDTVETEVHRQAKVENMLPGVIQNATPYFYEIEYDNTELSPDRKTVTVNPFRFTVRIPVQSASNMQYQDSGVTTSVVLHEGQKLVIGKVRTGFNNPADIFLVLTVRLHGPIPR